jgi:membrane-bound inhibitor of C-type lysozyme
MLGTWGTNKIIIDSNSLNYQGDPDTLTVEYNTNGQIT